jgi:hypothetical protein
MANHVFSSWRDDTIIAQHFNAEKEHFLENASPAGTTDFSRAYGTNLHFKTGYPAINRWAIINPSLAGRNFWAVLLESIIGQDARAPGSIAVWSGAVGLA